MKKYSILLVDDEQTILELLGDILEFQGYQITAESNSLRALDLLEHKTFDLVITDLMMPEVSGLEIARKVKQVSPQSGLIILTGHGSIESASQAVELGVDGYLQKPVHNKAIIGMVKKVLERETRSPIEPANRYKTLLELSSLLFQVNDFNLALDMIMDACVEYLNMEMAGIALLMDEQEHYQLLRQKNLDSLLPFFVFKNSDKINSMDIQQSEPVRFVLTDGKMNLNGRDFAVAPELKAIELFPVRFREETIAFLVFGSKSEQLPCSDEDRKLLRMLADQVAPVLNSFEKVKKSANAYENIISKIIKDRVYESRLGMNPISFALIRIVAKDKFEDSLVLEDAIRQYQFRFIEKLQQLGDLIWLTVDTAFFIFPNADLFKVESVTSDLKGEIEQITLCDEQRTAFTLKYACMSYPQSGEYAAEIINNLWLKLFDEIYFMQN